MEYGMGIQKSGGGRDAGARRWLALAGTVLLLSAAAAAHAQDIECKNVGAFPCASQIDGQVLQRAPTLLKLQARIAQAGMPIGTGKIPKLFVEITAAGSDSGSALLCKEEFKNVTVENSVLNLEIGREMDCELDEVLALESGLLMQLCLGEKKCQLAVPLLSTPYGIRASFARAAERAHQVDFAAQAHYAHRVTADRDVGERRVLGTGYFDFETPDQAHASGLYDQPGFEIYKDSGFMQWTPLRDRLAFTMNISAKDHATDAMAPLEELVLASQATRFVGDVEISPLTETGLTVKGRGVHIAGTTAIEGQLLVTGDLDVIGDVEAKGDLDLNGTLLVGKGAYVNGGTFTINGTTDVTGLLTVDKTSTVHGTVVVTGDATVDGTVYAPDILVKGAMTVDGNLDAPLIDVANGVEVTTDTSTGGLTVKQASDVGGGLTVAGGLESWGAVTFTGQVTFKGGTSAPGELPDMRYVQHKDEVRPITLGGLMSFNGATSSGAAFDGGLNDIVAARFHGASSAPFTCSAGKEGGLYLNTAANTLMVCGPAGWKTAGGLSDCGNGVVQPGEVCDDGNTEGGDGCSATCKGE